MGHALGYVSGDYGRHWTQLDMSGHTSYAGPPELDVRPDGSVVSGDFRSGELVMKDPASGRFEPAGDADTNYWMHPAGVYVRRLDGGVVEISADGYVWQRLSLDAIRGLVGY